MAIVANELWEKYLNLLAEDGEIIPSDSVDHAKSAFLGALLLLASEIQEGLKANFEGELQ